MNTYIEYSLWCDRTYLDEDKFIELAAQLDVKLDSDFIEKEIFFNRESMFEPEDFGQGEVIVIKNRYSDQLLILNTYLIPADQASGIQIAIRCQEDKSNIIEKLIIETFYDIKDKVKKSLRKLVNPQLTNILTMDKVTDNIFYDEKKGNLFKYNVRIIIQDH